MKAKWIKTDGSIIGVKPKNGTDFSLEELREYVGGHIEIVRPPSKIGAFLVINEEGKLLGLPVNKLATKAFYPNHDVIVGDALLCHPSQIK